MKLIKIDLNRIIRTRVGGWKGRLIPSFLIRVLEHIIHQRELNEVLKETYPAEGTLFCEKIYKFFGLTLSVRGLDNIPPEGRFIFASNHPLGGLDGIGLIKVLGAKYGDAGLKFLVNDMLMNIEPLRPVFLPINKYGSQGRGAAAAIRGAYESDVQILIFPAGLVSRLQPDGSIADLVWHKSFVNKAVEYKRDIIPVRFEGLNRRRFYRLARWRKKLGLKVNIEQATLPTELCAARGNHFSVTFGRPVSHEWIAERLAAGATPPQVASEIRDMVYKL